MMEIPAETDVFFIGGGPAGLAGAIAARAKGLRVVVADCCRPPVDKACGEGLMPDAVAALRTLGVAIHPERSFPFRGIRFAGSEPASTQSVDADFPRGHGIGVRRTTLHPLLIERAVQAGVRLLWESPVTEIGDRGVTVCGRFVRSEWVVGADGQNSRVRRWAALDQFRRRANRFGFRRHYRIRPWSDYVEIYWGADCQLYVTPVAPEEVCLAVLARDPHLRLDDALDRFPEVVRRLDGAVAASVERGGLSATNELKSVVRGRVALLGDASGSVDAITGDGLCLSFLQAAALAEALASGNLANYQSAHRRLFLRPARMGALLLALDRSGPLRRRVLRALAARPNIFSNLLAAHVGEVSPADLLWKTALPLGWRLLRGDA
ncbi:MAG: FAD-dependent monooxygenase [Bryobacteraceae bacterium]